MSAEKVFRVVEIKNNDLFVLYDVEGGGVCCCSKYTINQLIRDYGAKIEGATLTSKGVIAQELGLDGKPRIKKASIICADETKRSATTIIKGLDEKHYPRVKQERSSNSTSIEDVDLDKNKVYNVTIANNQQVPLKVGDIRKFTGVLERNTQPREVWGVVLQIEEYDKFSFSYMRTEAVGKYHRIYLTLKDGRPLKIDDSEKLTSITPCRLPENVRQDMLAIAKNRTVIAEIKAEQSRIQAEHQEEERRLYQKYREKQNALDEKIKALAEKEIAVRERLMVCNDIVDAAYMIRYIKAKYVDKLKYAVVRSTRDSYGATPKGLFDVSLGYNRKEGYWELRFSTQIDQRSSYMELRSSPYFFEEYDGELFGAAPEVLESLQNWGQTKLSYYNTLKHELKNGEFVLSFDASGESRKGYYAYNYTIRYKLKGKDPMRKSDFEKQIKQILG